MVATPNAADSDLLVMVRRETIGNTVASAVIAAALTWLIFADQTATPALAAPPGGIFGILPGTFNFTLLVAVALTLITRRRVGRGQCRRAQVDEGVRVGVSLPGNVLLRALTLAGIVSAVLVPLTYLLVWAGIRFGWIPQEWPFVGMLVLFVGYFVLLSLIVTPIVVWRALRD